MTLAILISLIHLIGRTLSGTLDPLVVPHLRGTGTALYHGVTSFYCRKIVSRIDLLLNIKNYLLLIALL